MSDWPFDSAPNAAAITCRTVLEGAPVLRVAHYSDDHSWAFLDGGDLEEADARVAAIGEVVALHPDVVGVADLPPGWIAIRDGPGSPWRRGADPEV